MNNIILGSGLIGRVAKDLYPDYTLIPFGKSRCYSFTPPLSDNYISVSNATNEYICRYSLASNVIYKRSFSVAGEIITDPNDDIITTFVSKVYKCQSELMKILMRKNVFFIYNIKPFELYFKLKPKLENYKLDNIDHFNRTITVSGTKFDYNKIISTIPLNVLYKYLNIDASQLQSRSVYIYDVMTSDLDFEGSNELLVVDEHIDFYKVQCISKNRYIFYSFVDLEHNYFSIFLKQFKILNSTRIDEYSPVGDVPKLTLQNYNIECVGSMARWDDFYDIGTSISKLLKI